MPTVKRTADPAAPAPAKGPATARVASLAPRDASEKAKFDFYAQLVRASGAKLNPGGKPTVLGLRGVDLEGSAHPTQSAESFDDVFVVLTAEGRVTELAGSTHPQHATSEQSPDIDGDGKRDVGMIRPGEYQVVPHRT